jgi:hypothetical protein
MAKKHNRPDTPLAATPDPGKALSAAELSRKQRAENEAESALKKAKEEQKSSYTKTDNLKQSDNLKPSNFL